MKTNNPAKPDRYTHEGAPAKRITPLAELRRTVLACLLFEDSFYESGEDVATRIQTLVPQCLPEEVAKLAVAARNEYRLRHAPLWLVRELARHPLSQEGVAETLAAVIQRADEMAEFCAMYWRDGKQPLSAQVKQGLAKAFEKFDRYQLAKYDRPGQVRMRDVMRLVHPKPRNAEQEYNFRQLIEGTLPSPDTWEVALSGGEDKKEAFERLLRKNKLGYMALLRNLRNMHRAGVDQTLVFQRLRAGAATSKALPFRYLAAARAVPQWEDVIDEAMLTAMGEMPKLSGKTILLVDHSYSMLSPLSRKSDLTRFDAAAALAVLLRGIAEEVEVWVFSMNDVFHRGEWLAQVPPRQGMALVDATRNAIEFGGTDLGGAVKEMNRRAADRLIVVTDEQSHTRVPDPQAKDAYMVNVASYQNGVGYGKWTHIDGFSEAVVRWIVEYEREVFS